MYEIGRPPIRVASRGRANHRYASRAAKGCPRIENRLVIMPQRDGSFMFMSQRALLRSRMKWHGEEIAAILHFMSRYELESVRQGAGSGNPVEVV